MIEFILAVVTGVLVRAVADECGIGFKNISRWIVKRSVGPLAEERERYEEQWLADLEDRKTAVRQMLFALGVVLAARVLRRESPQPRDAAKSSGRTLSATFGKLPIAKKDAQLFNEVLASLPQGADIDNIQVFVSEAGRTRGVKAEDLVILYRVDGVSQVDCLSHWVRRRSRKK